VVLRLYGNHPLSNQVSVEVGYFSKDGVYETTTIPIEAILDKQYERG